MQKGMLRPIHYDTEFCLTEQRRQFCQQCESIGTSCGKLGRADSCLDGGTNNRTNTACLCLWRLFCVFWQQISLVVVWSNHWLLGFSLLGKCFVYSNGLMDHMCVCEDGSKRAWYKKPGNFQGTLVKRCFYLESLYVFCSYIYSSVWLSSYKGIKSPSY